MRGSVTTHCLVNHHITGHLVFVLVSTERVMMCPEIPPSVNSSPKVTFRIAFL
jgi:hypothetical protein